ncbi:MAG TPA: SET domain-containing protein-lysine N-methyltransferase [Chloroflexota bacterium]|nr:SET domain-containing protein-lysine N-methyltransferase [Chloroflexota bacterium]HUM68352.1 SET domain-containing protein-lysine N-methyltransferase [Chloroflexota bacterium]
MADVSYRSITHWTAPQLSARPVDDKGGYGVFANAPIAAGDVVATWGGEIVTGEQLAHYPAFIQTHTLQIEENLFIKPLDGVPSEPADFINHSCNPNLGLSGQITLVALRPISPGEELCFDYAMSDGSPYDEFDCACGSPHCRGRVTGNDWQLPSLQERYAGHFSPYLQRRIDRWRQEQFAASRPAVNGRASTTHIQS